jgi:cholest-4-en-3-one 26-monooxygenase
VTSIASDRALPDLSDPATFAEAVPFEAFKQIRETPGLYWQPTDVSTIHGGFWAVTRFKDIQELEKNVDVFTSTRGSAYPLMTREPQTGVMSDNLMVNDPPRHTRLRRAASAGFGPKIVRNFEPWVRETIDEVIDGVAAKDEFDFIEEFCRTIPAFVVGRALGVPREDRRRMVDWTTDIFAATQMRRPGEEGQGSLSAVEEALAGIWAYSGEILTLKREHPAEDMFTELSALVDDGTLTESEFVAWTVLMMTAGYETTHTAMGQAMRLYLEDPDVREKVDRAVANGESELVAKEFIRLVTPAMQMARTATRDTELAGTHVREGDVVVLYFASANRDETVFENPDTFDPWRKEKVTLAFGSGIHRCIGSYLAILEVQVLFEELAAKNVKLKLNGDPQRGWSNFINQIQALPVVREK